ncbi:MAG: hypothetical protein EBX49_01315 [Synechococcaceae bacterium WB8_1B_136]|nr:hypothetical protein [Synechococcaceae bacterium WB8_1B_136]
MTQHAQPQPPGCARAEEQLVGASEVDPHSSPQYAALVRRYPTLKRSIASCRRSDLVGGADGRQAA